MNTIARFGLSPLAALAVVIIASDAVAQSSIPVTRVATGLSRPVFATAAPGDRDRLFIVEQRGDIEILDLRTGERSPSPLIRIPGLAGGGEQGLLGLAFDPDFASNGHFYINGVFADGTPAGRTEVRRYTVDGNPAASGTASLSSARPVLSFNQPRTNHNAGWMAFSPRDNQLYIATGDSGAGNDPDNAAQNLASPLGKILRVDPRGDDFTNDPDRNYSVPADNPLVGPGGAADEIWAYGLRNPFRNSFDAVTGDLIIGDVGQNAREEINFQSADSTGGENYGWRPREGTISNPGVSDPDPAGAIDPVYDYAHGSGPLQGNSVVGGYVYRGTDPDLFGRYIFADTVSDNVWAMTLTETDPSVFGTTATISNFERLNDRLDVDQGNLEFITSFGEDADRNLYITTIFGDVFRVGNATAVPEPSALAGLGLVLMAAAKRRRRFAPKTMRRDASGAPTRLPARVG